MSKLRVTKSTGGPCWGISQMMRILSFKIRSRILLAAFRGEEPKPQRRGAETPIQIVLIFELRLSKKSLCWHDMTCFDFCDDFVVFKIRQCAFRISIRLVELPRSQAPRATMPGGIDWKTSKEEWKEITDRHWARDPVWTDQWCEWCTDDGDLEKKKKRLLLGKTFVIT